MKKAVAIFLAVIMTVLPFNAYGAQNDLTVLNAKIVIKEEPVTGNLASYLVAQGKFTEAYSDFKMLVTLTKKDVKLDDQNIGDNDKYFGFFQYYINSDGTFDISEKIDLPSGEYTVNITADGYNSKYTAHTETISQEILNKISAVLSGLSGGVYTADTLTADLSVLSKYIVNDSTVYDSLTYEEKKAVSTEIMANMQSFSLSDLEEAFDKATVEVAINSAQDLTETKTIIEKFIKILDLENNPLYSETVNYEHSSDIYSFIFASKGYTDIAQIKTAYFDGYVISRFKNAMSANIKGLTETYKTYLNITPVSGDTNTVALIEGYIYERRLGVTNITGLKALIEEAKVNGPLGGILSPLPPAGGSTTVGGGGGGGSSVVVDSEYENENPTSQDNGVYFSDIPSSYWGYEAINHLYTLNVVSGRGDGKYYPDDYVTRAEFVKMIVTAYSVADSEEEISFYDVSKDKWYYSYIKNACAGGIAKGNTDGSFKPDDSITRQDAAVIIQRIINKAGDIANGNTGFYDSNLISDYAKDAVSYLSQSGIIKGFEDNTFRPCVSITRAEAAQLIFNALK